jgi:hypothetical protein
VVAATAILKALDMDATIEWYRRVGFELNGRFPESGDVTWCELERDGVVLQFLAGDTPWPEAPCFTGTIYFYPPSVTALYESIRHHTQVEWGPEVREWGMREIGLRDPNGYFITFAESVDR